MNDTLKDKKFMKIALELSKKAMGYTEPNPLVGALVVKNNKILSTGFHSEYGAEHAERIALKGMREKNTTLYVTLEPCSHFGKTPPCTDLILKNRVKRAVISISDPNPLVNGKGIKKLSENNVTVDVGILKENAKRINRHYFKFIKKKIPYITINAGISIDGKLTDKNKRSEWISDQKLRNFSHSLRGEFSSILAGVKTVVDDNPQLTIREKAWKNKKLFRIILDSNNILSTDLRIFKNQKNFPLILFSSNKATNKIPKVKNHFFVDSDNHGLNLTEILNILYELKISSILIEGGGQVIDSFLKNELYDEIILFTANKLLGGKESVELFHSGANLSNPVVLKDREIMEFDVGHIVRGYK